jgi:hypothetical protein
MNGTDGRICYRCSAISWEKLRPEVTERVFVCAITESVQELKRSSCPTCRVLGVAVDHRRLTKLEFASAVNQSRSIKLETTPDSTRSNLHLVYSRGLFSLKDNSHMLHAFPSPLKLCDRDDPYLLDLQADAPNRVDFELAKLWMADCGTHEKCNIPPKSDIDNLKVIAIKGGSYRLRRSVNSLHSPMFGARRCWKTVRSFPTYQVCFLARWRTV